MFEAQKLIEFLKSNPQKFKQIAKFLGVKKHENKNLSKELFSLIERGKIFLDKKRDLFFVPKILKSASGEIRVSANGFGFLDLEDQQTIFIPPSGINTSFDRDEVIVEFFESPFEKENFSGYVKEIVKRKRESFVGRVVQSGKFITIKPFDHKITGKFKFESLDGIKIDDEIKVKIIKYGRINLIRLDKVLGHKDDVSMDILIAIEDAGVPSKFMSSTISAAKKIPQIVSQNQIQGRKDLRDRMIVTIDGDDTKDFDDAIEVEKLQNGNYKLHVHIADVTYYVTEKNPLDKEAKIRGTSVYLADRVIPMLPKSLSNGICSLNPNADRLTVTCEMEIDKNGKTVDSKIYESVIKSKFRLTYKQVNDFYREKHDFDDEKLSQMITKSLELSKILRKHKNHEGYIDFEIPESKIIIDKNGKTVDIVPRDRYESEMMIEDFMVRANETVAHFVAKRKLSFIYRVHDKPDFEKVNNLQRVVQALGIEVKIPSYPVPKEFANSINQIKETRFDDFMKIMFLRTMAKAEYSPQNIGHFGLASEFYTHFTSPIRRYPDLMVHRMLREYFFKDNKKSSTHFGDILGSIAEHSSMCEQRAMDLERRVDDIKKAEFYERFIGKSLTGTIVSVLKFGFFVELENKVNGLVHISTLIDGEYSFVDKSYSIASSSRKFTIGDEVEITVFKTYKNEGKIDFVLSDLYDKYKQKDASMMKNYNSNTNKNKEKN